LGDNIPHDENHFDEYDIAILDEVARNPMIHSNGLRKRLVDEQRAMSARTLDIHKLRLIKQGHLAEKPHGVKKRLYRVRPRMDSASMRQFARDYATMTESNIDLIQKAYPKMPQKDKIMTLLLYLSDLRNDMGRTAMYPCFTSDPQDFKLMLELILRYQACVSKIFKLLEHDPDKEAIMSVLMNRLSDFQASKEPYFIKMMEETLGY